MGASESVEGAEGVEGVEGVRPTLSKEQTECLRNEGNLANFLTDPKGTHKMLHANLEFFKTIMDGDAILPFTVGPYRFHDIGDTPTNEDLTKFDALVESLLDSTPKTPINLDMLWSLFYVSGDRKFAERVRQAKNDSTNALFAMAVVDNLVFGLWTLDLISTELAKQPLWQALCITCVIFIPCCPESKSVLGSSPPPLTHDHGRS